MEEQVGALWHRLVTGWARQDHPAAAVSLEELRKTLGVLFRALGGDGGLSVEAASATRHGARRGLRSRLAGSDEKAELAWRDAETLRLPARIALFPERTLNRDLYLWLAALAACDAPTAGDWFHQSQAATQRLLSRYPGLQSRYGRLLAAYLPLRPEPERLPTEEAAQERAIRAALQAPGSVAVLPSARRPPQPVQLWLHPAPPSAGMLARNASDPAAGAEGDGKSRKAADARRRQGEQVEQSADKSGFLMFFRAESLLSWAEFVRVNRPSDDDDDTNADKALDDLDRISIVPDDQRIASRLRFDLDLPPAAMDETPLGEGILLPEWDYRKALLQPAHCRLQAMQATDVVPGELPPGLMPIARRLRRHFETLSVPRQWRKGEPDGEEPDLDACVRDLAERRSGVTAGPRGLYQARHERRRDLACLLLADLSLSTDAWVSNAARVIDVIRDSLFLFAEALSASGDQFALYGFSSIKRQNVRFHVLKDFAAPYDRLAKGRIAAIKPGYYTRMGAAIRNASTLLARQPARQRLLLLLTDGKPNDLDHYEGRYGIEDTRQAVQAARRQGLLPFCVTIDEQAGSYLPHLFGANGFVLIRQPADLPRQLPQLYAQLTRA
ncbi:nitric oxide reductase activation protein NorD [Thermithiobacillus plumbiphilus]|uniref:VWA domain-containing protein n=1 Tax=Thermithiobacillus plumbiphilus TaxID=1729899 RepID=A0ABU9D8I3_9PROT